MNTQNENLDDTVSIDTELLKKSLDKSSQKNEEITKKKYGQINNIDKIIETHVLDSIFKTYNCTACGINDQEGYRFMINSIKYDGKKDVCVIHPASHEPSSMIYISSQFLQEILNVLKLMEKDYSFLIPSRHHMAIYVVPRISALVPSEDKCISLELPQNMKGIMVCSDNVRDLNSNIARIYFSLKEELVDKISCILTTSGNLVSAYIYFPNAVFKEYFPHDLENCEDVNLILKEISKKNLTREELISYKNQAMERSEVLFGIAGRFPEETIKNISPVHTIEERLNKLSENNLSKNNRNRMRKSVSPSFHNGKINDVEKFMKWVNGKIETTRNPNLLQFLPFFEPRETYLQDVLQYLSYDLIPVSSNDEPKFIALNYSGIPNFLYVYGVFDKYLVVEHGEKLFNCDITEDIISQLHFIYTILTSMHLDPFGLTKEDIFCEDHPELSVFVYILGNEKYEINLKHLVKIRINPKCLVCKNGDCVVKTLTECDWMASILGEPCEKIGSVSSPKNTQLKTEKESSGNVFIINTFK